MMKTGTAILAAALVVLGAAACRAGEIGAAQLPADGGPAVAAAPGCGCGCNYCGEGRHDGTCRQRLLDWLTYCPPHTPCHCGCCGCCGKCTSCCTPLYMYFLDRCSCTLGYRGPYPCPTCCGPNAPTGPVNYSVPTTATTPTAPSSMAR